VQLALLPGAVFMTVRSPDFFEAAPVREARISPDGKTLSLQPDKTYSFSGLVVLTKVCDRPD
jgi:hypothetical protein